MPYYDNKGKFTKKNYFRLYDMKHAIHAITYLCVLFIFGSGVRLYPVDSNSPVERHGPLRTEGHRIVDQYGISPQLRGLSFSWSVWGGKKYYHPAVVDRLVDDFKVSVVRVAMAIEPEGGYLQQPQEQQFLIQKVVDQSIRRGIYVIIDWHDHHANLNINAAKRFFSQMAKRYSNIPNVIYEIWNEPEHQNWLDIKNYAVEVIEEIRRHDKQHLIIVGSPHWDQDVDVAATNPITGLDNIAYSFHFYASDPHHQENLRKKAEAAMHNGLPLMVTEWGVGESDGDGIFDQQKTETWVNWMESHQLSWVNWNITDKEETTAILFPGAPVHGDWFTEHLTPAGTYIRNLLKTLNAY